MSESLRNLVIVAQLAALISLLWRGLAKTHSALVAYLTANIIFGYVLSGLSQESVEYLRGWGTALPVVTALKVWMGWQAYGRSLELFPFARRVSHFALLGICVASGLLAQMAQQTQSVYGYFSRLEQGVSLALGVFCFGMIPLLNFFYSPVRRRNAIVQEWMLMIHYLGVALWILAAHWQAYGVSDAVFVVTTVAVCLGWATLLTRNGEQLPPAPPGTGTEQADKLFAERQMAALVDDVRNAGDSTRASKP